MKGISQWVSLCVWLLSFSKCSRGSPMWQHGSGPPDPSHGWVTLHSMGDSHLSVHQLTDTCAASTAWLLWTCCHEHLWTSFCLNKFSMLFGLYASQSGTAGSYRKLTFNCLKQLHHFTFLPAAYVVPVPHIILAGDKWPLIVIVTCVWWGAS